MVPTFTPSSSRQEHMAGVADHEGLGGNIHRLGQIDATKDDAGIGGSRAQGHIDLDAAMQANT